MLCLLMKPNTIVHSFIYENKLYSAQQKHSLLISNNKNLKHNKIFNLEKFYSCIYFLDMYLSHRYNLQMNRKLLVCHVPGLVIFNHTNL